MAAVQVKTWSDIYSAIQEELKVQSTDTTTLARIKRIANAVYLDEICAKENWTWLRGKLQVRHEPYVSTGTAAVTEDSTTVTLTDAPADSKADYLFSVDGSNDVYRIQSHTAGATTLQLEVPYVGDTASAASYKIWTDVIALPADCRETFKVTQSARTAPLDGLGLQKYRDLVATDPKLQGRPCYYSTGDFVDPSAFSTIGGIAASATRSSAGLVRTIVFGSSVASLLEAGDRVRIRSAGSSAYNGDFTLSSVSTTTITYTATRPLQESSTADTGIVLTLLNVEDADERYRELLVYPAINDEATVMSVDYTREPVPLENDSDEPLMPIGDRMSIVYGALARAWASIMRSQDDANRNEALFDRMMARMQGKLEDSTDFVILRPSRLYLAAKRRRRTASRWDEDDN